MNRQQTLIMLNLFSNQIRHDITRGEICNNGFHIPEITEEDRIQVNTPKIRKHATKQRINKLHDKKYKKIKPY
jgi:hypothetical protein